MTIHDKLAASHPSLSRGKVWCRSCGASQRVIAANAFRHGWPRCCGATMTIDSPEEQRRFSDRTAPGDGGSTSATKGGSGTNSK